MYMIEQEAKTCSMYQKLKHFVNLFFTMEMTHVVTFTVDKILDKADLAQSFCHKFVQICLQNEKWKILLSNPGNDLAYLIVIHHGAYLIAAPKAWPI